MFSNTPPWRPSTRCKNGVLRAEECGEPVLQLLVQRLRAADEAHRGEAVAPLVERLAGGLRDGRMLREAEVIVRAKVEHGLAAADADVRVLRRGDDALALVEPRLANAP